MARLPAQTVTDHDVDALIAEIEYLRAQTYRGTGRIAGRVRAAILRADVMLRHAPDDLQARITSARTLLHCLQRGIARRAA